MLRAEALHAPTYTVYTRTLYTKRTESPLLPLHTTTATAARVTTTSPHTHLLLPYYCYT
jgi:hypothetical protein